MEYEIAQNIDLKEVVSTFAKLKSRKTKRTFSYHIILLYHAN
jgi:hypothetical protein